MYVCVYIPCAMLEQFRHIWSKYVFNRFQKPHQDVCLLTCDHRLKNIYQTSDDLQEYPHIQDIPQGRIIPRRSNAGLNETHLSSLTGLGFDSNEFAGLLGTGLRLKRVRLPWGAGLRLKLLYCFFLNWLSENNVKIDFPIYLGNFH